MPATVLGLVHRVALIDRDHCVPLTEGETEARLEKQLTRSPRNRAGVCLGGSVLE